MGTIEAFLTLDTHGFSMGLNNARQDLQTFADGTRTAGDRFSALGSGMVNVGTNLTKNVTMPILGIGVASVKMAAEFEAQMDRVSAIADVKGEELEKLEERAKELGETTKYSSLEVAQGMEELASAGFDANGIYGAMPGLLDMAASGNIDLASAAEIAAAAFNGFGLTAPEDIQHVADVIAESAARTNASVDSMGYSFKYVAPYSAALNISLEETAAAIGILSDAGMKGTTAGTTLRGMFSRLAKPTEKAQEIMDELGITVYDNEGKFRSISDIIGIVTEKTSGLSEQEKNFALSKSLFNNILLAILSL